MKAPFLSALALVCFVLYLGAIRQEAEFDVSNLQLVGYGRASIIESSHDNADLYFAFRAARGDGMTTSGVRVHGDLHPGPLDEGHIQITQRWRPHIGAWESEQQAERVVAQVKELPDGSMRVAYVAYFDHTTSQGAFVVASTFLAK